MKIVFHAQSREAAGCAEFDLPAENDLTVPELWAWLIDAFPRLAPLQETARLARQENYLNGDEVLRAHDEIAVIPAVSGG